MSGMKIRISEMRCRLAEGGRAVASLTFCVRDIHELNAVCARLQGVSGVVQVRRGKS